MSGKPLAAIPDGSDVFIDANVFIYALNGVSMQCRQFLERCSREELAGISSFSVVNEATHRLMLAEARSKGLIAAERAGLMRANHDTIPSLVEYWRQVERILALNILLVDNNEPIIRAAQPERAAGHLLTNDSVIVSCMRDYGVSFLATNDSDFERVAGISVFRPDDVSWLGCMRLAP
jgi:predicted nucleic acid-binding protein